MESNLSSNSDFINTWDDIFGFDIASIHINNNCYHGYIERSPIEDRLVTNFNYVPVVDESKKPFMAHWMIFESKISLLYCNGIINEKRFYTTDIFPEYPDDDLLYYNFSGILKFSIQQKETLGIADDFINFDNLLLTFKNGILLKTEESYNL
jgi:hypothetical protein